MREPDLASPLADAATQPLTVGRYILHRQIARGGMATIHIARLMGDEGFSRIVAAKRLHAEFAEDSEFVAMFLDEARIASKVHHRNVVPVLDVVTTQDEVLLVQEYVHGAPLHWLLNKARTSKNRIPVDIAVSIACQVLSGLHAAHEMVDELGMPLNVVHRDVSPQNVMVATDGTARLLDFGVAKASMAAHTTREGTYKGKLAYSAPEQLRGQATRQSDLYSLAVMLWELIVGHRMHGAQSETELVTTIMQGKLPTIAEALAVEREWEAIGSAAWKQVQAVDAIVQKGLAVDARNRWKTAVEMDEALQKAVPPASPGKIATWIKTHGKDYLEKNDRMIAAEEASWRRTSHPIGSRRTPMPGAMRASATTLGEGTLPAQAAFPQAPPPRSSGWVTALLGALVAAVTIGILVFVVKPGPLEDRSAGTPIAPAASSATPDQPATPPATATKVVPAVTTPTTPTPPRVDEPVTQDEAATAATTDPATETAAEPTTKTVERTETRPNQVTRNKQPIRQPIRARQPSSGRATEQKSEPTPAVTPPPKATSSSSDCTPPYYFEGSKKIFKPACL